MPAALKKTTDEATAKALKTAEGFVTTSTAALTKCHTTHTDKTAAEIKTADAKDGKCADEADEVATRTKALATLKCTSKNTGGGATIIIIIVVVVALCCAAGLAYYFCVHKKKNAGEATAEAAVEAMFSNNDDLYMAFIDNETA